MKKFLLISLSLAVSALGMAKTAPAADDSRFDRNIVIEEGTGTWCGFCVSGIVMFEYVKATYPDRIFPISIHQDDRMSCDDYNDFIDVWFDDGVPCCWINRSLEHFPGTTKGSAKNEKYIDNTYNELTATPAYCRVTADYSIDQTANTLNVRATAEFAANSDVEHEINYVLTEDDLGPYQQSNYYTNNSNGEMGGWESRPSLVETIYDDVARLYKHDSLAATVKAGDKLTVDKELPLSVFTGNNFSNRHLIVFVTNTQTQEIVNSCMVNFSDNGAELTLAETDATPRYYTLQGAAVTQPGPGIYIRIAGGKATKVVIP